MLVEGATEKFSTLSCGECSKEFKAKVLFCPFCGKKNNNESVALQVIPGGLGSGTTVPASVHVLTPKTDSKVVPENSEPVSSGETATAVIPSEASHVDQVHQAEGSPHSGASDTDAGPTGRKPKVWRWVLLLGVLALIAFVALRPGPSGDAPSEANSSAASSSKDRVAKPQIIVDDRVSSVRLSAQWQRVDISTDPARPMISVSSRQPFRMRVNGQLYLIAAQTPRLIRFGGASFMELKALKGNTDVKITRSAMKEGG